MSGWQRHLDVLRSTALQLMPTVDEAASTMKRMMASKKPEREGDTVKVTLTKKEVLDTIARQARCCLHDWSIILSAEKLTDGHLLWCLSAKFILPPAKPDDLAFLERVAGYLNAPVDAKTAPDNPEYPIYWFWEEYQA